jgi:two-component system chemotaxis response regulator CheY
VGKTALVVDASMSIRRLVGKTLRRAGFEVLEAANGKEALERLRGRQVALVIIDLNMPITDRFEFIRAFREDEDRKFTPVVFLEDATATARIVKPAVLCAR